MSKVESCYDGLILGLVVGGLESKSERILNVYSFWEVRIKPAPLPCVFVAPSTESFQMGRSVGAGVFSTGSVGVNSMTKSAKTCPFSTVFGLYLMSNSLTSMAHFISLPEVSGLCNTCFIGYYVGTSMV